MSKFFNETQKASQRAQRQLANQDLDIKQMMESLKQGTQTRSGVAEVRLQECSKVQIGNGQSARLVLEQHDSAQAALEAYRGLRTKLMRVQSETGLRSIAITSSLPGEGKTLTAMNLALCYSQLPDLRVLVIDADLRTKGLTHLLGQVDKAGLAEVLAGQATPDGVVLGTNYNNLFVLPAGSVAKPAAEHFTETRWAELLGWRSESFKVIIVDTPPVRPMADFDLISAACDGIVMVVRAHHTERELLQKTANTLDAKKILGVVLNAAEIATKEYRGYSLSYGNGNGNGKSAAS
jgi:protein-tyrosine kinase